MFTDLKKTVETVIADLRDLTKTHHIPYCPTNLFATIDELEWIVREKPTNRPAQVALLVTIREDIADLRVIYDNADLADCYPLADRIGLDMCALNTALSLYSED